VLFNLLENAFRFTPPNGHVTVLAMHREGWCEVSVEDDGPGIPHEHLPLVFERFYRIDPSRSRDDGGTGLGLAIARSIVEAHGGRIWAESEPGRGARFTFSLPSPGDTRPAAPRARVAPPPVPTRESGEAKEPQLTGAWRASRAPGQQEGP
jgi:signal transduction histidine kinase